MKNKNKNSLPGKTKTYNEVMNLLSSNLLLTVRLCSNYQTANKASNISQCFIILSPSLSEFSFIKGGYNYVV